LEAITQLRNRNHKSGLDITQSTVGQFGERAIVHNSLLYGFTSRI